jgi:hypothetical protein
MKTEELFDSQPIVITKPISKRCWFPFAGAFLPGRLVLDLQAFTVIDDFEFSKSGRQDEC